MKLLFGDLNSGIYSPYLTSTDTCRITNALRVCDDKKI